MDNREVITKFSELVCDGTAEKIVELYNEDSYIISMEASSLITGKLEILRYFDWFIKKDPWIDITEINEINFDKTSIYNGFYTEFTMEATNYKRFTFVVVNSKIITMHTSINPDPIILG